MVARALTPWRGFARRNSPKIHFPDACSCFAAAGGRPFAYSAMTARDTGWRRSGSPREDSYGGRSIKNKILPMNFVRHGVAVGSHSPRTVVHRFTKKRKHFTVVFKQINLNQLRRGQVQEAVTDGGGKRSGPRTWIKQPKCGRQLGGQEIGHEAANFWRGKKLSFLFAAVDGRKANVL